MKNRTHLLLLAAVLVPLATAAIAGTAPIDGGHATGSMMLLDTDKDGFVSKDEFVTASLKGFETMDSNKDGKLDKEEIENFRKKMTERMKGAQANPSATPSQP